MRTLREARFHLRWALPALLLVCAFSSQARVYQWVNPQTGTLQLSGNPPSWYRSEWGGPRVRVYENGKVIDDTSIQLAPSQSEVLREKAFRELDERMQLQALRRLQRATAEVSESDEMPLEQDVELAEEEPMIDEPEDVPEVVTRETIDRLKDIISEWDRRNTGATLP